MRVWNLLAVSTFVIAATVACGSESSENQGTCVDPPKVDAVRDATGNSARPAQTEPYVTCDGVTTENELALSGGWPASIPPLRGEGPLEVAVSPAIDELVARYVPDSASTPNNQVSARTQQLRDGRFSVDAPPSPGCWLLEMDVGVGWAIMVTTGEAELPCPAA